ncbi:MAG: ribonuclease III [Proteobacteria bacterium]|nr:MAG: ribonuclease III [Pseudomonadota bacterium]PIE40427.1 MAG: ribonuclease III [Gammaproteobacteria bacterium]
MLESGQIIRLEKAIGYTFTNRESLQLALRHRSLGSRNNERLEFLGDSLLNCVIAEYLFHRFPKQKEGHMSRLRAGLVRGTTLSEIAREFNLGEFIQLGAGELKSGGFRRDSILADSVEAIIGAIYLDSDFEQCKACILSWFEKRLNSLPESGITKDSKTRLQEFLQSRQLELPNYEVVAIEGEAHDQTFYVDCFIPSLPDRTKGKGASRRVAEQEAAHSALLALGLADE